MFWENDEMLKMKSKRCSPVKQKLNFLTDNLAVIESQRHIDDIDSISRFHSKWGEITENQEKYVDILVENVQRTINNKGNRKNGKNQNQEAMWG
jgi:hypothetical protein